MKFNGKNPEDVQSIYFPKLAEKKEELTKFVSGEVTSVDLSSFKVASLEYWTGKGKPQKARKNANWNEASMVSIVDDQVLVPAINAHVVVTGFALGMLGYQGPFAITSTCQLVKASVVARSTKMSLANF